MVLNVFNIEKELALQGLTKKRLAELSGVRRQNITALLQKKSCEPITAGKIAKALGVDVEQIILQPDQEATHEAAST